MKSVQAIVVLTVGLLCTWPDQAGARTGQSRDRMSGQERQQAGSIAPAGYSDYYEITARSGYLVGGEGATGDVMQYRGERIWTGPGSATVLVHERNNTGFVMGTVRTHGHTYTVLMNQFKGEQPFMSGGIAKNVKLHGLTEQGGPVLPKVWAYLAGWGAPCTVWKDAEILYEDLKCHFMLTEQVRDPRTHRIPDFPSKQEMRELTKSKRQQTFYEEPIDFGSDQRDIEDIEQQIREAGDTSREGLQLHLMAHSPETNFNNLPPYETVMHFMWDDVQWRSGPGSPRTAAAASPGRTYTKEFDQKLKRDINRYIKRNPFLDHDEIDVRVNDGVVTLAGVVDTRAEAEDVKEYAQQAGARDVQDELVPVATVEGDWDERSAPFGPSSGSGTFDYFTF